MMLPLLATFQASGQSLEEVIQAAIDKHDIPAMAALTLRGDRIIEVAAAGVRVRGGNEQVTLDDYWHLGSCTKAMTATLAARLVEQGILSWDSTISQVLQDVEMHDGWRDVTLAQLLTNRGGMPKQSPREAWRKAWSRDGTQSTQIQAYVEEVLLLEPACPAGEYEYSNSGFTVAGHMCAVAGNGSYDRLMQKEIFGPLGMTTAGYAAPLSKGPAHPNGHEKDGTPSSPEADNPPAITPAGRVHCTIEDWSRFIAAHLRGGQGRHDLLSTDTFKTLQSPAPGDDASYGFGWINAERGWAGGTALTHAGSNTTWFCVTWIAPARDMAVLVACNQGGDAAAKACDDVASACIQREMHRRKSPEATWDWNATPDRTWIGPSFWANRLQDWQAKGGRIECIEQAAARPQRTCHVLTHTLSDASLGGRLSVRTGAVDSAGTPIPGAWSGLLIGAGGRHVDHRLTAQTHHVPAEDGGLLCLVDETGQVHIRRNDKPLRSQSSWAIGVKVEKAHLPALETATRQGKPPRLKTPFEGTLEITIDCNEGPCQLKVRAFDLDGEVVDEAEADQVDPGLIEGGIALVSHRGPPGSSTGHWFDDLQLQGGLLLPYPERAWGPVLMTQYTIDDGVLNLTAQLPPLGVEDERVGTLEIMEAGSSDWIEVATARMDPDACTLRFRVEGRDPDVEALYRVLLGDAAPYEGLLRAEPDDDELVLGAMNCQKVFTGDLKWNHTGIWMPHKETVESVEWHDPDMLFFAGDQIYEGDLVPVDNRSTEIAILDYLYKWYRFCWSFGELTRDRPTVTIPDDHDVYHGNIWGAGGKRAVKTGDITAQDSGGYRMPPQFVNAVHRTQTSHLPDPVDPTPIEQDISVYYTSLDWGGVSFAILADRMFKSSPTVAVPAGNFRNGWPQAEGFKGQDADVEGAELLGERQEAFFEEWATEWKPGIRAKGVLSQTLFGNLNTLPPGGSSGSASARGAFPDPDDLPTNWSLAMDGDSNGWPQSPRDDALRSMRKGFAFHVCGDQHLGSTVQYGIEEHQDAGWAFCVPAIANTWPRRWYPPKQGDNRKPGDPGYTGDFEDGFGNLLSVAAVANPARSGREPTNLHDRMPGYGIIRVNLDEGDVLFECWPRWEDPSREGAEQYPGWPVAFDLLENGNHESHFIKDIPAATSRVRVLDARTGEAVLARPLWGESVPIGVPGVGPYIIQFYDADGTRIQETGPIRATP